MIDSLIELFRLAPVAFIIGVIGFGIFLPLFGIACALTDFSAEGQKKSKKAGIIEITITHREVEKSETITEVEKSETITEVEN